MALRGPETVDWESARTMVLHHEEAEKTLINSGILRKTLKLWAISQLPPRDYRPACVEDPLNPLRNLANNATMTTLNGIQKEMWRVCYILTSDPLYVSLIVPPPLPEPPSSTGEVTPETKYLQLLCEKFRFGPM